MKSMLDELFGNEPQLSIGIFETCHSLSPPLGIHMTVPFLTGQTRLPLMVWFEGESKEERYPPPFDPARQT